MWKYLKVIEGYSVAWETENDFWKSLVTGFIEMWATRKFKKKTLGTVDQLQGSSRNEMNDDFFSMKIHEIAQFNSVAAQV